MSEENGNQPDRLPWAKEAEATRRAFIKREFEHLREQSDKFEYTLSGRLIEELTLDASAKVRENHPHRHDELDRLLEETRVLVFDLMYAATSHEEDWEKRELLQFWSHNINPGNAIKNKSYKLMQRNDVERVASRYLNGSVRGQLFDRTLVDMLLAFEVYQFGDEMFHPFRMPGLPVRSPMKWPHPLWAFIRDTFIVSIVLGGVGSAASWAMSNYYIGNWGNWIIGICIILWLLNTGLQIVLMPWVWSRWAKARRTTRKLIEAMLTTYSQMQSDSVISAQHVLDSVKASAVVGVVWPSPVFVLLEDVVKRGGRL
jgi:hypothetical protein